MFSILNRALSWAITSSGNKFCLKKRSRLIKALNNRIYVKFMQLEIGLSTFRELASVVSNWQSSDLQSTIFALRDCHNCCVDGETLVPTANRFSFI